ncbi:hypothetical protein LTR78_008215 [Recurvomyces mirabilis]|uniref:Galactose oxidase n=1 Tax=Recurvomyces mirabilis TaxID=574656 RepID=A0AAE0WHR8_9PEZI|nr:hypothetical protein LTR78_008215 [Recurvomyces mirabilis]KAK5156500.1 hypothetical protein LTS14_004712 [Recurvomyces mirabilis]
MPRSTQIASLLAFLGTVSSQILPYNPARVLLGPNSSYAYIFPASTSAVGASRFQTVDLTKAVYNAPEQFTTSSQTLPFLKGSSLLPYTPVIDASGNITVLAGDCSQGANGTELWRYTADASTISNGNWAQSSTTNQEQDNGTAVTGPNFLASGLSFSQYADADETNTGMFVFGGMCPLPNATTATWTNSADYSNMMLTLSQDSNTGYTDYDIGMVASKGPPIPEAGFSITPLAATFTASTNNQPQKQQQNFVLLGGHTKTAFINMSQVAVFSLPQQTWTFLPVSQPSNGRTVLSSRQNQTLVEPRSGHTAVLSEDGTSVILMGGWVGDVNTPAQPQFAVLTLGSGFGGNGDWSWSVPTSAGAAPSSGGMYGHGAAMLPGNIMMIVGGYEIQSGSSKLARRGAQSTNGQIYFYNASSSTWIDSYTPSNAASKQKAHTTGALSNVSQKAGLGAGLGIGAAILIGLIIFYFWYNRRLRLAREARGRTLLSGSSDGSLPTDEKFLTDGGIDGQGGDAAAVGRFWNVWDHDSGAYPPREEPMQQAGTAGATGLFVNIPSPTRGLRKGVGIRSYQYHAAPRYDDKRISRGSGNIPPIAEHEDEDDTDAGARPTSADTCLTDAERRLKEVERVLNSTDPFLDGEPNPLRSHPVSPEVPNPSIIRRKPVSGSWTPAQVAGRSDTNSTDSSTVRPTQSRSTDAGLHIDTTTGRVSPTKSDERTSSILSTRSTTSSSSVTRTMETRTGAILAAAAAARAASNRSPEHSQSSSNESRSHTMSTNGGRKSPFYYSSRARSPATEKALDIAGADSADADDESFKTARTDFVALQSQGEALLGGRPRLDSDDPYQRAMAAQSSTREAKTARLYDDDSGPPSALGPRRRQGWMGSLRRALNVVSMSERSFSMTSNAERTLDEQREALMISHSRDRPGGAPRRTVSDGGALLKKKRGQQDWEDGHWPRYRDDPDPGDWGEAERSSFEKQKAEEEWDVEGAASRRDVQVMFTVPKARLRVVNADLDRISLRSASDGALSRTNSVKNLRREESIKTLRARSEGDRIMLPPTSEEEGQDTSEGAATGSDLLVHEKAKAA